MKNVHEGGFGLIEVLITLIVLAVGLVALAKFQGTAIESGSLAKARTVATHLAQQKLDDLRDYELLIETDASGVAIACNATDRVSYRCIATDAGGNKQGGALLLPALLPPDGATVSNVTYNRAWAVTDYCFRHCPPDCLPPQTTPGKRPNEPAVTPCPAPVPAFPDFKQVTVTVRWTDQDGDPQNVVLRSIISASDPLYSGRILE